MPRADELARDLVHGVERRRDAHDAVGAEDLRHAPLAGSGRAPRLPFACGLTTTPMPGTQSLRCRSRHGELAARRLDVLAAALADRRVHAAPEQDLLEAHDARRAGSA